MPGGSAETVALQKSQGFIPKGYDRLPREVFRNLFFSTTNGDSYRPLNQRTGALILANCRSKSVQDIHDASKLTYKRPEAPLWQRSMCEYTQQYTARPLDGVEVNSALYTLFKQQQEDCSTRAPPGTKLGTHTTSKSSYTLIPQEAALKAIPESFKPEQVLHVDPVQKLMVTTSTQHKGFSAPTVAQVTSARPESCKPKQDTHTSISPFYAETSYARDYYASKYRESWPERFAQQGRPPPPTGGYTGIVKAPKTVEGSQILEKFHIGDMLVHSSF